MTNSLPVASQWFRRRAVDDSVTVLDEPHVDGMIHANIWHVRGADRDLLIDSGCGISPLRPALPESDRDEPLLVLTHGHLDHMGGAHEFDGCWAYTTAAIETPQPGSLLGPELADALGLDFPLPSILVDALPFAGYEVADYAVQPARVTRRLSEGDRVELGDMTFTVLHVPGHSPDSIALLDEHDGVLFSGDVVYDDVLLDNIKGADPAAYRESLRRLCELPLRIVHPGHGESFDRDRLRQIADAYLASSAHR